MTGVEASAGLERAHAIAARLRENVESVIFGKRRQVDLVLAALASRGHVLLEDVPGTAKTMLARALAGSIEGTTSQRIQCTPDLQPTDITGLTVYNQQQRDFEFRPGPIFANVVLVDEINRAMPRTQSALLEAMAELQVTVDGTTRSLPEPFLLLATENPVEQEGTFPLPEAQLDRFFVRMALGYPGLDDELRILQAQHEHHPLESLVPVVTRDELLELQEAPLGVYVDELVTGWIVELVRATREIELVALGASVRGSLALERVARAYALVRGRAHVTTDDVEELFWPVIGHRLVVDPNALLDEDLSGEELRARVWQRCVERAPRPAPTWQS